MAELDPILLMKPRLPSWLDLRKSLKLIDESGIYSNFGPLNLELIDRISNHFRIPNSHICTVANATLGLEGAIRTANKNEALWSIPSWTFTATAAAVINSGNSIEFLDIDEGWRVTPTPTTRNLVDVLPFGGALDLDRLPNGIENLVIDAAASFDTLEFRNFLSERKFGLVISLHATKLMQSGEGGIFISNDVQWVERFKSWTNFGMSQDRTSNFLGTNAKLSEYSSAVGLASLKNWNRDRQDWMSQTLKAREISHRFELEVLPPMENLRITPYWIIKTSHVERIKKELIRAEIPYRLWWGKGCHKMPAYSNSYLTPLPNTDLAAGNYLGLPFHLFLNRSQWLRIEMALEKACT